MPTPGVSYDPWTRSFLHTGSESVHDVPKDVHGTQLRETDGAAEQQHPLPDILLCDNRTHLLTGYKLLDDIMLDLAVKLKIQL